MLILVPSCAHVYVYREQQNNAKYTVDKCSGYFETREDSVFNPSQIEYQIWEPLQTPTVDLSLFINMVMKFAGFCPYIVWYSMYPPVKCFIFPLQMVKVKRNHIFHWWIFMDFPEFSVELLQRPALQQSNRACGMSDRAHRWEIDRTKPRFIFSHGGLRRQGLATHWVKFSATRWTKVRVKGPPSTPHFGPMSQFQTWCKTSIIVMGTNKKEEKLHRFWSSPHWFHSSAQILRWRGPTPWRCSPEIDNPKPSMDIYGIFNIDPWAMTHLCR